MFYIVDDPTYPLIALSLTALVCLIALQVTQQGKFLIWAVSLLGVTLVWFTVERFVVTDSERVEAVVYALATAVSHSDVEGVEALLAPEFTLGYRNETSGIVPVEQLLPLIRHVRFDLVKVRQLQAQAGSQTKRGSAEFKVAVSGVLLPGSTFGFEQPFPPSSTEWSLGFREVSPKVWRVTRITAISLPRSATAYLGSGGSSPTPALNPGSGGGGRRGPGRRHKSERRPTVDHLG